MYKTPFGKSGHINLFIYQNYSCLNFANFILIILLNLLQNTGVDSLKLYTDYNNLYLKATWVNVSTFSYIDDTVMYQTAICIELKIIRIFVLFFSEYRGLE